MAEIIELMNCRTAKLQVLHSQINIKNILFLRLHCRILEMNENQKNPNPAIGILFFWALKVAVNIIVMFLSSKNIFSSLKNQEIFFLLCVLAK